MANRSKQTIKQTPLDLIDEPKGILRMEIDRDYIAELAESISEVGLLQPILVAIDGERFEIVFGHRRYLACQHLGLWAINAIQRQMTAQEIGMARATENIARADLTPVEEAATYKSLLDEYDFTIEQVAKKMGKSAGTIKRRMDLLKMPPLLQQAVHKGTIGMTVAEELWSISDNTSLEYYLSFAVDNGCTREVARQWAKDWKDSQRRAQTVDAGGGLEDRSPNEPRPTYTACDICTEPVEVNEAKFFRTCKACHKGIIQGMEATP